MHRLPWFVLALALTAPAAAATLDLRVQVPSLHVAEYHRPYIAIWVERADRSVAAQLAVWYAQEETKEGEGAKWLPDLRQWWRRGGRDLALPVDGVTGATRPAGEQRLRFEDGKAPLGTLAPGAYTLVVEAVREVGGRETLRLPFTWPAKASAHVDARGEHELGAVRLDLNP